MIVGQACYSTYIRCYWYRLKLCVLYLCRHVRFWSYAYVLLKEVLMYGHSMALSGLVSIHLILMFCFWCACVISFCCIPVVSSDFVFCGSSYGAWLLAFRWLVSWSVVMFFRLGSTSFSSLPEVMCSPIYLFTHARWSHAGCARFVIFPPGSCISEQLGL